VETKKKANKSGKGNGRKVKTNKAKRGKKRELLNPGQRFEQTRKWNPLKGPGGERTSDKKTKRPGKQ